MFHLRFQVFRWLEYEILLMHGRAGEVSTFLPFGAKRVTREKGLPTFTLEKLVPGGIAEVSP